MNWHMYGVGPTQGEPRALFSSMAEAETARTPQECIIEYSFSFVDSEVVTWPDVVLIDLGGEE